MEDHGGLKGCHHFVCIWKTLGQFGHAGHFFFPLVWNKKATPKKPLIMFLPWAHMYFVYIFYCCILRVMEVSEGKIYKCESWQKRCIMRLKIWSLGPFSFDMLTVKLQDLQVFRQSDVGDVTAYSIYNRILMYISYWSSLLGFIAPGIKTGMKYLIYCGRQSASAHHVTTTTTKLLLHRLSLYVTQNPSSPLFKHQMRWK